MDLSFTKATDTAGKVFQIPVTCTKAENKILAVIKKEDIAGAAQIDILPQLSDTPCGEGYFAVPMLHRSYLTYFKPRQNFCEDTLLFSMPFYGVKRPGECFIVLLEGLAPEARLYQTCQNGSYRICFRFDFQADAIVPYDDIPLQIIFLRPDADYNDMARAYREYQYAHGLQTISEKQRKAVTYAAEAPEIRLRLAWKPVPTPVEEQTPATEPKMHAAIPFDRLKEIMLRMHKAGIEKAELCLVGWNQKGHDGRYPQLFPVEEALGGEKKLKEAIALGQKLGYQITAHSNSTDTYRIADCFREEDVLKKPDGSLSANATWSGGRMYNLCPRAALKQAEENLPRIRALGFEGLHYIDVLSIVQPRACFDPKHTVNRTECVAIWRRIAALSQKLFGGFASEGGCDFLAHELDFALYAGFSAFTAKPLLFQDALVPLWEIVYHGSILYCPSTELVNAALSEKKFQLKLIEYGGRPVLYFYARFVTPTGSRGNWMGKGDLLCATDAELEVAVSKIKETYDLYREVCPLQYAFMEEHKMLTPEVAAIRYSDNHTVIVNYGSAPFQYQNTFVPAEDFRVFS